MTVLIFLVYFFIFQIINEKSYRFIFDYVTRRVKPYSMIGKANKNKWKSFKKKCKNFWVVFSPKDQTQTNETGTLFRKCWSPRFQRHLQKIVIRKRDLPQIWAHFHLNADNGGHRGMKKYFKLLLFEFL